MTDDTVFKGYAFHGKRPIAEQAADVFARYAPGSSLSVVLDEHDESLIAAPRNAVVTTMRIPGRMYVAVLPEGTR